MKTEEDTINSIKFSLLGSEIQKNPQIMCIGGNEASDYCVNSKCFQQQIFRCWVKQCQCHQDHKVCLKADLDSTIHKIQSRITDTANVKQTIYDLFDALIDQLSDIRDGLLSSIEDKIKYHQLHEIEKEFYNAIFQAPDIKFTPKQSARLWEVVKKNFFPKFDIWKVIKEQMDKFKSFVRQKGLVLDFEIRQILKKQQLTEGPELALKSSILTEGYLINRLATMFEKKISSMQLLFRASEHDFSLTKFYELCGKETNTMVVCKTNKDKIIGGYTPLSFNPDPEYKGELINGMFYRAADPSSSSMIFSLTQNDKFKLVDSQRALRLSPFNLALVFGNVEFTICEKSDRNFFCQSFLGNQQYQNAYFNPNYKDDKESYLKLNGNETEFFTTKEWEVWKMDFGQKQRKTEKKQNKVENLIHKQKKTNFNRMIIQKIY